MWHLNSPTEKAMRYWELANKFYPNAIYLVNSPIFYEELCKVYDRVHLLPRFIDPDELPKPKEHKTQSVIWFGNVWKHHEDKFEKYKTKHKRWISKSWHNQIGRLTREQILDIVNDTEKVYAIGLCAMEAKHLGCEVVEYDGNSYDVIYPQDAIEQLNKILVLEKTR